MQVYPEHLPIIKKIPVSFLFLMIMNLFYHHKRNFMHFMKRLYIFDEFE